jgi:hypothetical protein
MRSPERSLDHRTGDSKLFELLGTRVEVIGRVARRSFTTARSQNRTGASRLIRLPISGCSHREAAGREERSVDLHDTGEPLPRSFRLLLEALVFAASPFPQMEINSAQTVVPRRRLVKVTVVVDPTPDVGIYHGPAFHKKSLISIHPISKPDAAWAGPQGSAQTRPEGHYLPPVSTSSGEFRHVIHGSLALVSPDLTCRVLLPPFPATLTTNAFNASSSQWFGACS